MKKATPQADEKRSILVRVPLAMYEDLLNLSAAATLLQRRSVSVPGVVLEILDDALKSHRGSGPKKTQP